VGQVAVRASRVRDDFGFCVEEVIVRIAMTLLDGPEPLVARYVDLARQPEDGVVTANRDRAKNKLRSQSPQMQIEKRRQKIGAQLDYIEGRLIHPQHTLVVERRLLPVGLEVCRLVDPARILREGNRVGLSAGLLLAAEIAEPEPRLVGAGEKEPLISKSKSAGRSELACARDRPSLRIDARLLDRRAAVRIAMAEDQIFELAVPWRGSTSAIFFATCARIPSSCSWLSSYLIPLSPGTASLSLWIGRSRYSTVFSLSVFSDGSSADRI